VVTALEDVHIERDDDGVLVVRWRAQDPVDVRVGSTPVASEHIPRARSVASGFVRLDRSAPRRAYVSLVTPDGSSVVVAERRVPFSGISNLRDLGGYGTANGGVTRWGRVFRADALHKLTLEDLEAFHELSVVTVYDLRGDAERGEFPGPVPSLHVPIVGRPRDVEPPAPPPGMTTRDGEEMLRDLYVGALVHSPTEIGIVLRGLSDPERTPAVFHCHGGKDRTGIVAAVLLLALGVDRDTVLDDYEATSRYRLAEDQHDSLANMLQAGVSPEAAAGVLGAPRWAMAAAVDGLLAAPGGVEAFLTGAAGLELHELTALRDHLTARS
jgi:protein-tyrosine phosphatase